MTDIRKIKAFVQKFASIPTDKLPLIDKNKLPAAIPTMYMSRLPASHRSFLEEALIEKNIRKLNEQKEMEKRYGRKIYNILQSTKEYKIPAQSVETRTELKAIRKIFKSEKLTMEKAHEIINFCKKNEDNIREIQYEYERARVNYIDLKGAFKADSDLAEKEHEVLGKLETIKRFFRTILYRFFECRLMAHYLNMEKTKHVVDKCKENTDSIQKQIEDLNAQLKNTQKKFNKLVNPYKSRKQKDSYQMEITKLNAVVESMEVPILETDLTQWLDVVVDYNLYKANPVSDNIVESRAQKTLLTLLLVYCRNQEASAEKVAKNPFLRTDPADVIKFLLKTEQFVLGYFKNKRLQHSSNIKVRASFQLNRLEEIEKDVLEELRRNKNLV